MSESQQQYPFNLCLIKDAGHIIINLFFYEGSLEIELTGPLRI